MLNYKCNVKPYSNILKILLDLFTKFECILIKIVEVAVILV
jgi:hypothetical protein